MLYTVALGTLLILQPPPSAKTPTYPEPGSNVPGSFYVYNVTGKKKDNFHCLVTEHGLNPVAMIVVRGTDVPEAGFRELLAKVDNLIDKNPATRMVGFVLFETNTVKDLAREDEQRKQLAQKLEDVHKTANSGGPLRHLTFGLTTPASLAPWKIEEKADVTVILYNELQLRTRFSLPWEQLKAEGNTLPAKAKEILDRARLEFKATR